MWNTAIVQWASRLAVALLVVLAAGHVLVAVGLLPLALFQWRALHGSASNLVSAVVLVLSAGLVDRVASRPVLVESWMRTGAWLVTAVTVALAVSYLLFSSSSSSSSSSSDSGGTTTVGRWVLGGMYLVVTVACAIVASSTPSILTTPVYQEIPA